MNLIPRSERYESPVVEDTQLADGFISGPTVPKEKEVTVRPGITAPQKVVHAEDDDIGIDEREAQSS